MSSFRKTLRGFKTTYTRNKKDNMPKTTASNQHIQRRERDGKTSTRTNPKGQSIGNDKGQEETVHRSKGQHRTMIHPKGQTPRDSPPERTRDRKGQSTGQRDNDTSQGANPKGQSARKDKGQQGTVHGSKGQ